MISFRGSRNGKGRFIRCSFAYYTTLLRHLDEVNLLRFSLRFVSKGNIWGIPTFPLLECLTQLSKNFN